MLVKSDDFPRDRGENETNLWNSLLFLLKGTLLILQILLLLTLKLHILDGEIPINHSSKLPPSISTAWFIGMPCMPLLAMESQRRHLCLRQIHYLELFQKTIGVWINTLNNRYLSSIIETWNVFNFIISCTNMSYFTVFRFTNLGETLNHHLFTAFSWPQQPITHRLQRNVYQPSLSLRWLPRDRRPICFWPWEKQPAVEGFNRIVAGRVELTRWLKCSKVQAIKVFEFNET